MSNDINDILIDRVQGKLGDSLEDWARISNEAVAAHAIVIFNTHATPATEAITRQIMNLIDELTYMVGNDEQRDNWKYCTVSKLNIKARKS